MGHQIDEESKNADETASSEQAQTSKLEPNNDYQSELIPYSRALALAENGDAAPASAEAVAVRPHVLGFDPSHSLEMAERYKKQANAYNESRLGHGSNAAAFTEQMAEAAKYDKDAENIREFGVHYNSFVPLASFAVDEVIRFKTIQSQLGGAFQDEGSLSEESLSAQVGDRKEEFAEAMHAGDIKTTKGLVAVSALAFNAAQDGLYEVLSQLRGEAMQTTVAKLKSERTENVEKKERINAQVEAYDHIFEGIGQFIGKGEDSLASRKIAKEELTEQAEGAIGIGKLGADAAGFVVGRISWAMHANELAMIESKLAFLDREIVSTEDVKAMAARKALHYRFKKASHIYKGALAQYENALASRRTAYAKAGTAADKAHAHGRPVKNGDDKASQTMLFISAARETTIALRTALEPGKEVEDELFEGLRHMAHRDRNVMIADWAYGSNDANSEDRQQGMAAYGMTYHWVDASEIELTSFEHVDAVTKEMLAATGKAKGEY